MTSLLAAVVAAAVAAAPEAKPAQTPDASSPLDSLAAAPIFSENATAAEMLAGCRAMVPEDVVVTGHINRRSRHGTEVAAYSYRLKRIKGETELTVYDKSSVEVPFKKGGRILDTDVTWSDLTLDYLWWKDVTFDESRSGMSNQGIVCKVLLLRNGNREVRAWVDRRTGAMLQAEESFGGKVVRELFCTSLKKFGDRWAPRNIEVGPKGARYRTKIVVEDVRIAGDAK